MSPLDVVGIENAEIVQDRSDFARCSGDRKAKYGQIWWGQKLFKFSILLVDT